MKRIFLFLVVAGSLAACSKDKFKTEPQVEIKSFGPKEVYVGQLFTLSAVVRDKEGDTNDSILIVRKLQVNAGTQIDTLRVSAASFGAPQKDKINLDIVTSYGPLLNNYLYIAPQSVDRTFSMGLVVIDKAHHRSSYVESEQITLKKY